MAAGQDYWWVTGGAVSGHALCTAAAVIGGRAIAGKVSLRVGKLCIAPCDLDSSIREENLTLTMLKIVTLGGGFAFLAFGIIYLLEAMYIS